MIAHSDVHPKLAIAAAVALLMAGPVSPPLPSSRAIASSLVTQVAGRAPNVGPGSISGVVVNERHEPVAGVTVQVFAAGVTMSQTQAVDAVPLLMRPSGSVSTDAAGSFRISGLALGEYLVAASPILALRLGGPSAIYSTTFYPSVLDSQRATRVSAFDHAVPPIQIELVRVRGASVSGSVVSASGRPTTGMSVRLYHRFGGFGSESSVAAVSDDGTFEIPRLPPGWYRLTIGTSPPDRLDARDDRGEVVQKLIEVQDSDVAGLSLVLRPVESISGRIVGEAGTSVPTVGLRVSASPTLEQFAVSKPISTTVASNLSFRMSGLSGSYQFTVSSDRPPLVAATRVTVDGVESPASAVSVSDGAHDVVVFVAPREPPKPTIDRTLSPDALVEQFKSEKMFWRQFEAAKAIVERQDKSVVPSLAGWLSHEDRHIRGNAAFVLAGLGDPRGFQAITEMLTDRSDRPAGQGIATASGDGRFHVARQIAADRYYAVHLLGDLRDPRAVSILIPLLKDAEVNSGVPWALGQIGDKLAVGPLLDALDDESPSMRVLAIYALEALRAKEALPRLVALLSDQRRSNFGALVSVADAAKAAIAKLQ